MASEKKPAAPDVVLVSFAYAEAKDGEVVQLVKGDVVDIARFRADSVDHLRSIGFVGTHN
ncbi:MAG: hypothetical protein ABIQ39_13850 [Ilumatobacteraceae bacterium]